MGILQNEDHKSESELVAAGGAKTQLLNDTKIYVTAKNINETLDDAITLGKIGGSGSGGVNYITNSDFATDVSGYNTYADATGTSPVDGTGGSPSITFTRNTSTPLRGLADGKISKPASNCQGEGVSTDIVTDLADACQPAKVSFSYRTTANFSYTNQDLRIFMYDTDTSQIVPVTPYYFDGSGKFVGEFQFNASTSNDYRLIFHIATTNALSWDFFIDDVSVGPSNTATRGVPTTDWIAWTPTGSWSTNTTYTGFWRRVGDSAEYQVKVALSGSPQDTSLTVNLPHTIDTSKLLVNGVNTRCLGLVAIEDAATANYIGIVGYNSTTSIMVTVGNASSTYLGTNSVEDPGAPISFGNGDSVILRFSLPIAGWSSNVVLSDGEETRVVCAMYYCSTTGTTSTTQPINLDTKIIDTHSCVTASPAGTGTWRLTAPITGNYQINGFYNPNAATNNYISIYKNGSVYASLTYVNSNLGSPLSGGIYLLAGEYIDFRCAASTTWYGSTLPTATVVMIVRSPGPATIAASEKVVASMYRTSNATITKDAFREVTFSSIIKDTHAFMNINGRFTTQVSGYYNCKYGIMYSLGATPPSVVQTKILINGAGNGYAAGYLSDLTASKSYSMSANDEIYLNTGDYVSVWIQSSGQDITLESSPTINFTYFAISKN